jgi:Putative porin
MRFWGAIAALLLWAGTSWGQSNEVERLSRVVEEQGREIEELKNQLARIERALGTNTAAVAQPVSYTPAAQAPQPAPATAQTPATLPTIAGFRFSGDLRFRLDASVRGAIPTVPGLQNIRQRYRFRFNADREVASDLAFHAQLSTGAVNNGITFDQDFAGGVTRHPFFISEAWMDYHPNANTSIRGGRLEEIYADNSRFLWDDDVRFNGFNERWKTGRVEFRAGQYSLINPNTFSVPPGSPFTLAGIEPGTIARAGQMFHQGISFDLPGNDRWRQQVITDVQVYRNPNLVALTSTATGVGVTVNPAIGLTVSGPATGTGNALRSPTSAILFAPHFQIIRAAYRLDSNGLGGNPRLPMTWIVQTARNVGTSQLRDAMLTSISIGRTTQPGDLRGLYTFAIKDANSIISQFTDDDLGTAIGVNIATHHIRMDYTIRPNILFQNLLFLQTERRSSNPAASFFVPLGRETPRTWRYQGQLAISF